MLPIREVDPAANRLSTSRATGAPSTAIVIATTRTPAFLSHCERSTIVESEVWLFLGRLEVDEHAYPTVWRLESHHGGQELDGRAALHEHRLHTSGHQVEGERWRHGQGDGSSESRTRWLRVTSPPPLDTQQRRDSCGRCRWSTHSGLAAHQRSSHYCAEDVVCTLADAHEDGVAVQPLHLVLG